MTPVGHGALIACAVLAVICAVLWQRQLALRRAAFIRRFELPKGLFDKLRAHHPALTEKDCRLVAQGLRQFFLAYLQSGRKYVSMPSRVADDLWHEFILYTKSYDAFCRRAFGRFLHHTPAVVLGDARQSNEGIRRCWRHACLEENIDPRTPTRLPLLFALDGKLNVSGGFRYVADCSSLRRAGGSGNGGSGVIHCGGDLSGAGADGATGGIDGGSDADSGDGGCGGGCGGGGD